MVIFEKNFFFEVMSKKKGIPEAMNHTVAFYSKLKLFCANKGNKIEKLTFWTKKFLNKLVQKCRNFCKNLQRVLRGKDC